MNKKLFNTDIKSFRLIKSKEKNGNFKKMVAYTTTTSNTLFLPIVNSQEEIFNSLKSLFGTSGLVKSFYRYYFPKKLLYTSTLYPKPRQIMIIDDKLKKNAVLTNIGGFRGVPRNKLMDRRNTILDYTDVIKMVMPIDKSVMTKPTVLNYIENVIPELICYLLFKNDKHVEIVETDEKTLEDMKNEIDSNTEDYGSDDEYGEVSYEEFSDEVLNFIENDDFSLEAFTEKLLKNTKLISMGGPIIGLDQFGFDKFIVSFPITLRTTKFLSMPFISGKLAILRNVKTDPELIYQLSFIRFIYKLYENFYNGTKSGNDLMDEMLNHNMIFHLYSKTGLSIVIDFDELKNILKWNPVRILRMMISRLSLFAMSNNGVISDKEIDEMVDERTDIEFKNITNDSYLDNRMQKNLNNDIKSVIDDDLNLQVIQESKNENKEKVEEIVVVNDEELEKIDDKENLFKVGDIFKVKKQNTLIPTKENVLSSMAEMKALNKTISSFSENKEKIYLSKSDDKEESSDVSFSDSELNNILNETDNSDEDDIEVDNSKKEIDDIPDAKTLDDVTIEYGEFSEDSSEKEVLYDDLNEKITSNDFDNIDEEIEDGYTKITPKENSDGPIKIRRTSAKKVIRTPAEIKRINLLKEKYKSIKIDGVTIEEMIGNSKNIDLTNYNSNFKVKTLDKSASEMALINYQKSYITNNYQSDIINSVRSLSMNKDMPMYITDAKIDDTSDQFTDKLTYTFVLEDELKKKHTLKFNVPKLDENGFMKIGGNVNYLKKQLLRNPIVKISPSQVYITTQLNSCRVERSGILLNRGTVIIRKLFGDYLTTKSNVKIERGSCMDDNVDYLTTIEYDTLSSNYYAIVLNKDDVYAHHIEICLSQKRIRNLIKEYKISTGFDNDIIPDNYLPIAIDYTSKSLYSINMDDKGSVYSTIISILNEHLGDPDLIKFMSKIKTPKRRICTKTEIQSKIIPLIIFLNYTFGWETVRSYFPENEIEFSKKLIPDTHKLSIKFNDGYLYYNQYPLNGALLLNGFTEMNTEDYKYADVDDQGLYLDYVKRKYDKFSTNNIVKGWVNVKESLLDLKTLQILEALNLPTDLLEIFLYCNDLLVDNQVKPESDISNYRIRGHEIISECVYKVLNDQYNVYKKRTGKKLTLSIPQTAIMSKIYNTELLENYDCSSPIGEIKEISCTTFKGPSGTKESHAFTMQKRAYNKNYFGIFAMTTPDNQSAGIIKELTVNPKIINTLGFLGEQPHSTAKINDIVTISEAIVPFTTKLDDPNRVSFASIQNKHIGGILNSSIPIVRTGVEKTIHQQIGSTFCKKAKHNGVISDIDEIKKLIFISYDDGTKETIDYKNQLLKNSDAFIEHSFELGVKIGQKIKKDTVLVSDPRFFKIDPITNEMIYTQGRNVMIAILEGSYTEDDSSLITETLSNELKMNFTKRKQLVISPKDTIIEYKNIGDHVKLGDPIFVYDNSGTLEDSDSEFDELFKSIDIDSLSQMIHQTPKANHTGEIVDIKIYWTVPIENMSPSVAKLVNDYIRKIKKDIIDEEKFSKTISDKRKYINVCNVERNMINGMAIDPKEGGVLIEYFISHDDTMSVGDKVSLHGALKTVDSTVVPKELEPYRENGKLDGIFSLISINARMINSVWVTGSIGKILHDFSKDWANDFLKEIGE